MKKLLILAALAFFATTAFSQANLFSAGVCHTAAAPAFNPGLKGCRLVLDTTSQTFYVWKIGTVWVALGRGVDEISGCSAPAYTPNKWQSSVVINKCTPNPELYYYFAGTWKLAGGAGGATYTAGAGIAISGANVISNTGDLSNTNEIQNLSLAGQALSISSGTGVTLPVVGATAADFDLASGVLSLDYINAQKATAVVPGFLTAADWAAFNAKLSTEVDGSVTNELNTSLGVSGANLALVDAGGTLTVPVVNIAPVQSLIAGTGINITGASAKTINSTITQYTDENAQDAVGAMAGQTLTYVDATPLLDVKTQMSVTSDASGVRLSGDAASPGNTQLYGTNGSGVKGWYAQPAGGGGTVTSVGLSLPSIFSVSGSPVTTTGTLTGTLATQTANTVFSGPVSGIAATPTFRALVAADIPAGFASLWTDAGAYSYLTSTTDRVVIGSAVDQTYRFNVIGTSALHAVNANVGYNIEVVTAPISATAVVQSGGSMPVGQHWFRLVYYNAIGSTSQSAAVSATTYAGNATVQLTIPVSTNPSVIGRKIYKANVGLGSSYGTLVATIANNTATTYTHTAADAGSSSDFFYAVPNLSSNYITVGGTRAMVLDPSLITIGAGSGNMAVVGAYNVVLGGGSGVSLSSAGGSVLIGNNIGRLITTGSDNIAISGDGGATLSAATTAERNIAMGRFCLEDNVNGADNIGMGYNSLANTTGAYNIGIGFGALSGIVNSSSNTAIGHSAGFNLTGAAANGNVFLGSASGQNALQATSAVNSIAIGAQTYTTASNHVILGNTSITAVGIGTFSPARKLHIESSSPGNIVTPILRISNTTSGTATTGFGVGTEYELENGSGTNVVAATEEVTWSDAVAATEDATYSLNLIRAGTLTNALTVLSTGNVGIGQTTPTAALHIKAGTATANTAPAKLTSGPLLTVSEPGAVGYNNSLYFTKNSGLRFGIGGIIFKSSTTVPNVTTTETDLYSHTLPASALATENESIEAAFSVSTLGSATATTQNRLYFGGTLIYDSGAIGFSVASDFRYTVEIIRESATVVKVSVTGATTGATAAAYTVYTRITGLTLTNTQVLRITGTRAGVGSASGDINGTMSTVKWFPAAG